MTVTMRNAVFWNVTPCRSFKYRRIGRPYGTVHRSEKIISLGTTLAVTSCTCCVLQLLVTAKNSSSLILFTLTMEAIRYSEISVLTRATWRHTSEESFLYRHRRGNLKSYSPLITSPSSILLSCYLSLQCDNIS
jgi:hypothetical protein